MSGPLSSRRMDADADEGQTTSEIMDTSKPLVSSRRMETWEIIVNGRTRKVLHISLKVLDEIVGDAVWVCEEELNKEQMTIDEAFKSNKEGFERGQSQLAAKLNELKE